MKGGDAIEWVRRLRGLSFVEAVADLVGGTPLPAARQPVSNAKAEPGTSQLRPPADEVQELWNRCVPIKDDAGVMRWFEGRPGIDIDRVEDLNLVRALPAGTKCPAWAAVGRWSWTAAGMRLIVPAYDPCSGDLVTLHARRLPGVRSRGNVKGVWPRGHRAKGAVWADPLGRTLLAGGDLDGWEPPEPGRGRDVRLVEGVGQWLTWATYWGDNECAPAVLGFTSGGLTPELVAKLPPDVDVTLHADADAGGDGYRAKATSLFAQRPDVRLFVWGSEGDQ